MDVLSLLDRPIAYHRVFVTLTGSVKAAVLLSQAVYWQKRAKQADGWWYKTAEEWEEETGLSKRELMTARKDCEKYLKTDLRGIPATLFWHVDEGVLSEDLLCLNSETSLPESAQPVVLKAQNKKCLKRTTRSAESVQLEVLKAHNLNTETTSEITTEINAENTQKIKPQDTGGEYFEIYETNIGSLTPIVAEQLQEIKATYPAGWFEEAVKIALNQNVRKLSYIQGILKRWEVEGFKADAKTPTGKPKNLEIFIGSRYEEN